MQHDEHYCEACGCCPCSCPCPPRPICPTGPTGATGATGPVGPTGPIGPTGSAGPGNPAENIPYPSSFDLGAWNFPPEGSGISDFFIQNDMTLYTTLVINTEVTVSEVVVLSSAFAGVIGPLYVGIYNYNRELIARSNDVASYIAISDEPVLSTLPLQSPVALPPGKYYVAFSIDLGGGQGFNLLSEINFMFLLQDEPYSNYYFEANGLPNPLPFEENGYYGIAPFIGLA